jgi:hexosaminidase
MNKLFLISIVFLISIACQSPLTPPTAVLFKINTFDMANNQMEVTFSITNPTETLWKGGEWSLHWNQISGALQPESLPNNIQYTLVNGQQYLILDFGRGHDLKPGETKTFDVLFRGIISREVMGPNGFFVHNAETNTNLDLESTIVWKTAAGIEDLKIPSAEDRYTQYEGLEFLPKKELHWVIPAPRIERFDNTYRPYLDALTIHFGSFQDPDNFIINRLQEGVKTRIAPTLDEDATIKIKENKTLESEAYLLQIDHTQITIEAHTSKAVFYALESLHQILLIAEREGKGIPILQIEDAPRFQNRGFMTDIARNFFPKEKIFQILDFMALYKLNRLDLKLTDDEGWRIEIPDLPELTQVGGRRGYTLDERDQLIPMYGSGSGNLQNSGSGYLSGEDFKAILRYANQRHIEVIPQISFPSHARAAIVAMKSRYLTLMETGDPTAAEEYMLHDPDDQSTYRSAQLFTDNVACICDPSAYRFYEKVVQEIKTYYTEVHLPMNVFNIGADELPYGPWRKSPKCETYIAEKNEIEDLDDLYNYNLRLLHKIIKDAGAQMAGWEDVLLIHSENEQSEITINTELLDLKFTPYVWNNSWGGGREDMIYRLANQGFKAIMSNSSAFYFDMTDDRDFENGGFSWSGYVNYQDAWGTEPLNVFANQVKLESLGITEATVAKKEQLKPEARENFLGVQSQLWTETVNSEVWLDQLLMPNLLVFAQRAWSAKEPWLKEPTADLQKPKLLTAWNRFTNTLGQRQFPLLNQLYGGIQYDLPKPGAQIIQGKLHVRQQFPGLEIHYSLNGKEPTAKDPQYKEAVVVPENSTVTLRVFDSQGRGGNSIQLN